MTAAELLDRVAAAYAACTTYRDEGVVATTFYSPARRTERRPFSTRFVRGAGFRFEFRSRRGEDDWDQYVIWQQGETAQSWWSVRPDREGAKPIPLALAAATGVSGGSASRIPRLLMPDLEETRSAWPREQAMLIAVPEAEEQNCIVVELPPDRTNMRHLWIDRKAFLIRRVVSPRHPLVPSPVPQEAIDRLRATDPELADRLARMTDPPRLRPPADAETTTTYEAAFDTAIQPHDLTFAPPAA